MEMKPTISEFYCWKGEHWVEFNDWEKMFCESCNLDYAKDDLTTKWRLKEK